MKMIDRMNIKGSSKERKKMISIKENIIVLTGNNF